MKTKVKNYGASVYYSSTGSSHSKEYAFTQEQADEVGGILEEDGLDIALAEKLCQKWTKRGNRGDIRYNYWIPFSEYA